MDEGLTQNDNQTINSSEKDLEENSMQDQNNQVFEDNEAQNQNNILYEQNSSKKNCSNESKKKQPSLTVKINLIKEKIYDNFTKKFESFTQKNTINNLIDNTKRKVASLNNLKRENNSFSCNKISNRPISAIRPLKNVKEAGGANAKKYTGFSDTSSSDEGEEEKSDLKYFVEIYYGSLVNILQDQQNNVEKSQSIESDKILIIERDSDEGFVEDASMNTDKFVAQTLPRKNQSSIKKPEEIIAESKVLNEKVENIKTLQQKMQSKDTIQKDESKNKFEESKAMANLSNTEDKLESEFIEDEIVVDKREIDLSKVKSPMNDYSDVPSKGRPGIDYDYDDDDDYSLEDSKQQELLIKAEKEREYLLEKLNKLDRSIQELKHDNSCKHNRSRSKTANRSKLSSEFDASYERNRPSENYRLITNNLHKEAESLALSNENLEKYKEKTHQSNESKNEVDEAGTPEFERNIQEDEIKNNYVTDDVQHIQEENKQKRIKFKIIKHTETDQSPSQKKTIAEQSSEKKKLIAQHYAKIMKSKAERQADLDQYRLEHEENAAIECANLVKRLNVERKKREEKLYAKQRKIQAYWDEQIRVMDDQKQEKAQQENANRIMIRERIEKMEREAEVRARTHKQSKRVIRELLENDPTTHYYEDKYFFENIIPEAKRVKQLQIEHKMIFRPVRQPEIAEHAALHDDRKKLLNAVKYRSRSKKGHRPVSNYKSSQLDKLKEREEFLRQQRMEQNSEKIELLEKRMQYGQYVHENYMPRTSSGKAGNNSSSNNEPNQDPVRLQISARRNNKSIASNNIDTVIDYGFDNNPLMGNKNYSEQTPIRIRPDNPNFMYNKGNNLNKYPKGNVAESPSLSRSFKITPNAFTNRIMNKVNFNEHEPTLPKKDVTNSVKVVNKYNQSIFANENNRSRISHDDYNRLRSDKITIKKAYNIPTSNKKLTKFAPTSEFDLRLKKKNVNFDSIAEENTYTNSLHIRKQEKRAAEAEKKLENISQRYDNIFFNNVSQNNMLNPNVYHRKEDLKENILKPWQMQN